MMKSHCRVLFGYQYFCSTTCEEDDTMPRFVILPPVSKYLPLIAEQ